MESFPCLIKQSSPSTLTCSFVFSSSLTYLEIRLICSIQLLQKMLTSCLIPALLPERNADIVVFNFCPSKLCFLFYNCSNVSLKSALNLCFLLLHFLLLNAQQPDFYSIIKVYIFLSLVWCSYWVNSYISVVAVLFISATQHFCLMLLAFGSVYILA